MRGADADLPSWDSAALLEEQRAQAAAAPRTRRDLAADAALLPLFALERFAEVPAAGFRQAVTRKLRRLERLPGERGEFAAAALQAPGRLWVLHCDASQALPATFAAGQALVPAAERLQALLPPQHVDAARLRPGEPRLLCAWATIARATLRGRPFAYIDFCDTLLPSCNMGQLFYVKAQQALSARGNRNGRNPPAAATAVVVGSGGSGPGLAPQQPATPLFPHAPTNLYYWLKVETRVLGRGGFFHAYRTGLHDGSSATAVAGFEAFCASRLGWGDEAAAEYLKLCGLDLHGGEAYKTGGAQAQAEPGESGKGVAAGGARTLDMRGGTDQAGERSSHAAAASPSSPRARCVGGRPMIAVGSGRRGWGCANTPRHAGSTAGAGSLGRMRYAC